MFNQGTNEDDRQGASKSVRLALRYCKPLVSRFLSIFFILSVFAAISGAVGAAKDVTASKMPSTEQNFIPVPIPHPATMLLRSPLVHRELHLQPRQLPLLENVLDEIEIKLWPLRDVFPEERNEKANMLLQQLQQKLKFILTTTQIKRYQQLVWQGLGLFAYLVSDLQSNLQLSSSQRKLILDKFQTLKKELSPPVNQDASPSGSQRMASTGKLLAQTQKDIYGLLNDRQRQKLGQIIGKSFDLGQIRKIARKAPEFKPVDMWLHTTPLTRADLKGKVAVVHFYTYNCINCVRNLPYYNRWVKQFPPSQFRMIGIHRSETENDRDLEQIKQKAAEAGMQYPIAVDGQNLNWDAWENCTWPSIYLIDKNGFVRYWWYGQLNWQGVPSDKWMFTKIEELLREEYPAQNDSSPKNNE